MTDFDPFASAPADEAQAVAHDYSEGPPAEDAFAAPPPEAPAPAKKAPAKKAAAKKAVGEVTVDVKPNILPVPETGLSVTFKGGPGFEAPWLVPKYGSVSEALLDLGMPEDQVSELSPGQRWDALMTRVQAMAQSFAGKGGAPSGGGGAQRQAAPKGQPQGAQEAPGGEKRYCEHGEMRFRSGTSKAGKPYKAFFCTSQDRNDECKAQFLR